MIIKLAFLKKNNETSVAVIKSAIQNIISDLFVVNENNEIILEEIDELACVKIKKNILHIELNDKPSKTAKELSSIFSEIIKGSHRKDFNIILIKDDASEYYIDKIIPLMNSFERLLRELMYLLLIKKYGAGWIKILDKDAISYLKSKKLKESEIIENGLNELTLNQIETLLFNKYLDVTPEKLLSKIAEEISNKNTDINAIEKMINENTARSNWERLSIGSLKINSFDEKIDKIRRYRNIIAHNKTFHAINYDKCRPLLKDVNSQLEFAIAKVENDKYDRVQFFRVLSELSGAINSMLNGSFRANIETMREAILPVYKQMQKMSYEAGKFLIDVNSSMVDQNPLLNNGEVNEDDEDDDPTENE